MHDACCSYVNPACCLDFYSSGSGSERPVLGAAVEDERARWKARPNVQGGALLMLRR